MMSTQTQLSGKTFKQFSLYIKEHYGIKLPEIKRVMLECRLRKRLRDLDMESFEAYADFVFSEGNTDELVNMVDAVTTNKTDFFREPQHFDLLNEQVLDQLVKALGAGVRQPLRVWSAACSTGEEPYTLAMVLAEYAEKKSRFDYTILATDLSTRVLRHAQRAVYAEARVEPVEYALRKKYLLRSKDRTAQRVRMVPALRKRVQFQRLNLLEDPYPDRNKMHIIFCRNVFIYFDRQTQLNTLNKMCETLSFGGYLFIGHSESLNGMDLPLKQVASTVYQRI